MTLLCPVLPPDQHLSRSGGRRLARGCGGLDEATLTKTGGVLAFATVAEAEALPGGPFTVAAYPAVRRSGAVGRLRNFSLAVGLSPGTLLTDQLG
jgi:hypothetical protein